MATKPQEIGGYLADGGVLTDWNGKKIGTYRLIASWKLPNMYISDRMFQVEAIVNGVTYTGRSAGVGMAYRGKRKKTPPRGR
jgi:hypothetical protein